VRAYLFFMGQFGVRRGLKSYLQAIMQPGFTGPGSCIAGLDQSLSEFKIKTNGDHHCLAVVCFGYTPSGEEIGEEII
jgi:hypothetical protein